MPHTYNSLTHVSTGGGGCFYGAVDLGSHRCRLLRAEKKESTFQPVRHFIRTTRLGEGLTRSLFFESATIERTLSRLSECVKLI